jgi:hypothetical protein
VYELNTIGLGSNGAIIGLLSSWSVWIIFRWRKVPKAYHRQRNCQLATVTVAVLIVLGRWSYKYSACSFSPHKGLSFATFVDWAANLVDNCHYLGLANLLTQGGAVQGILWGAVVLSHELENVRTKASSSRYKFVFLTRVFLQWIVRLSALAISALSFGLVAQRLSEAKPDIHMLYYYLSNDDWSS